jgi:hypothetical protein
MNIKKYIIPTILFLPVLILVGLYFIKPSKTCSDFEYEIDLMTYIIGMNEEDLNEFLEECPKYEEKSDVINSDQYQSIKSYKSLGDIYYSDNKIIRAQKYFIDSDSSLLDLAYEDYGEPDDYFEDFFTSSNIELLEDGKVRVSTIPVRTYSNYVWLEEGLSISTYEIIEGFEKVSAISTFRQMSVEEYEDIFINGEDAIYN